MKRLFLILAICLIIALSAVWGYLLFFGAPDSTREFFANFNFGDTEETAPLTEQDTPLFEITDTDFAPTELDALRQLTTKPVAGYTEVVDQISSSTFVYFIEAGTGHIFKLDTVTGIEERLSNVTIPNAQHGYIYNEGTTAVVQSEAPGSGELTVVELTGVMDSASSFPLITNAHDFALTENKEVLYTLKTNTNLEGYSYNIETKVTTKIFTLPFREAVVLWGESANSDHFTYPKADSQLEGYLYKISGNGLIREPLSGFGFTAKSSDQMILSSEVKNNTYISAVYVRNEGTYIESGYGIIPEKCLLSQVSVSAICAVPINPITSAGITNWYKGIDTQTDGLVLIAVTEGQSGIQPLVNLQEVSGRNIDAVNLSISEAQDRVYFQNNIDRTLWLYTI